MPALSEKLVGEPPGAARSPPRNLKYEVEIARGGRTDTGVMDQIGRRSALACPDCHGLMWEIEDGGPVRFRCHVGRAYTAELMAVALDENLYRAMGSALRTLEARQALAEKLRAQAANTGRTFLAKSWARKAREFAEEIQILRDALQRMDDIATND
jgi:two-component system, chemotaxis family, protein-glutamate methylesterase/glutaminase